MSILDDVHFMNKYNKEEANREFRELINKNCNVKLYKYLKKEMIQVI